MEEWTDGWMGELDALSGMRRSAADTTYYSMCCVWVLYSLLYMAYLATQKMRRGTKR